MPPSNAPEEEEEAPVSNAAPPLVKAPNAWGPVLFVIILMPALSYAMTQFVLIPKMRESLYKAAVEGVALPANGKAPKEKAVLPKSGSKKDDVPTSFEYSFDNIVVNLSGTKGTRYLKTSFTVFSSNSELRAIIDRHKVELLNLTLNILSAKTLVDLEVPGAKNVLLSELQENYNHTLNSNVVEQIYFSEFVIQ